MNICKTRRVCLLLPALVLVLCAFSVSSAMAAQPWWQLNTSSRPTNLWKNTNEEQELRVPAGIAFELKVGTGPSLGTFWSAPAPAKYASFPKVSSSRLRKALEGANGYGAGNVEVTPGAGVTEPGEESFVITTAGALAGRPAPGLVEVLRLEGSQSPQRRLLSSGGSGGLVLTATNLGDTAVSGAGGSPVSIVDTLPTGMEAFSVRAAVAGATNKYGPVDCVVSASVVSCTYEGSLPPYEAIEVEILVGFRNTAEPSLGEPGEVTVAGGNAPSVSAAQSVNVSETPTPFGVEAGSYEQRAELEGGMLDTQAGSHPFQYTTTVNMNQGPIFFGPEGRDGQPAGRLEQQPAAPRNYRFRLPPGLVGNATAAAQCTEAQFTVVVNGENECPASTAIGVAAITFIAPKTLDFIRLAVPLFNLTPAPGEPARFGFVIADVPTTLTTSVRTGEDYGVTVNVPNVTETATILDNTVTFWGEPGNPAHDSARGWNCVYFGTKTGPCERPADLSEAPFLRLPTSCGTPLSFPMQAEPWNEPLGANPLSYSASTTALDGCEHVPFAAAIEAAPDVQSASSPSGLTVHVRVPNETVLAKDGISEGDVRNTTVALPKGVGLDPSGAVGLEGCSESLIGLQDGGAQVGGMYQFTPTLPDPLEPGVNFCPNASKVGTVSITSPLVSHPLEGAVYLASPAPNGEAGQNPFDTLVALYIVAEDPVSGTLVKLPGKVVPCEAAGERVGALTCQAPGQLLSTFENTPQLPFEDLELHFYGGANAPLATPGLCGSYQTEALFESWSGKSASSTSHFDITSGPDGAGCANPQPFSPEFQAGTTNIQAGGFSELRTTMGHPDADQILGGLSIKLPPGLSGLLSSVKLCGESEANAGTCGEESLIGHTVVTAGFGSDPVVVKRPGNVYITGPYKGAPFGLSIVNPAEAGPFNLGNVVVRAKIEVNPTTAALTVTSDPLPTIIKGIPLDLQHVQVVIDREVNGGKDFTFNPTNCGPMKIEGTMSSSQGATAPVSSPFQVTNCATLKFEPKFSVSTSGHTSKAGGASLTAKLSEPANSLGNDANIAKVKVELPEQLPSRLTTLQKACTNAQFEANPAGCPSASFIGHAVVHTPLLPVPLEGPAIFVSHGGEAWPSLTMVLQGDNVTIDLVGTTHISGSGVTSTTFNTVPDTPFSTFELTLPEGSYSALTANANLCAPTKTVLVKKKVRVKTKHGGHKTVTRKVKKTEAATLSMPTEFIAQNGAEIHETTPISVTGCAKKTTVKHAKKKKGRKGKKGKKK